MCPSSSFNNYQLTANLTLFPPSQIIVKQIPILNYFFPKYFRIGLPKIDSYHSHSIFISKNFSIAYHQISNPCSIFQPYHKHTFLYILLSVDMPLEAING